MAVRSVYNCFDKGNSMNRSLKVPALAIVAMVGIFAFPHQDALARVLDASGQAINDVRQGLNDWSVSPNAANATKQELPAFTDVAMAHRRATELVDCIQLDTAKSDAEFRLSWTTQ